MLDNLQDATLVLVGHGATENRESAAAVQAQGAVLRARGLFREVLECFWMVEPRLTEVWSRIRTRAVYVVPVTISDGYFTTEVIPTQLGLNRNGRSAAGRIHEVHGHQVFYCRPIGSHPSMTGVLLARARQALADHPALPPAEPGSTALFIAGHGTERNRQSRVAIERQVRLIRERGLYAEVHAAFMMEAPFITDCWNLTAWGDLVMVPFFISNGLHTAEDIPILLGQAEDGVRQRVRRGEPGWQNPIRCGCRRLWYTAALGTDPHLADIIVERVQESESSWILREDAGPAAPWSSDSA
jgi:sirohydrochlorin cobaltochelatase